MRCTVNFAVGSGADVLACEIRICHSWQFSIFDRFRFANETFSISIETRLKIVICAESIGRVRGACMHESVTHIVMTSEGNNVRYQVKENMLRASNLAIPRRIFSAG